MKLNSSDYSAHLGIGVPALCESLETFRETEDVDVNKTIYIQEVTFTSYFIYGCEP